MAAVCVASIGHAAPVHAEHGTLATFQSGDIKYMCNKSLSDLDYEQIITCTEFGKASATWSTAISNLDLTNASSNAKITVSSKMFMDSMIRGMMIPHTYNGELRHATIEFSTNHKWGDSTNWWHVLSIRHDFQTIALHELGHALGLNHTENSPLMKMNHPHWEVQRTIPTHDKNAVQEKFRDD